MAISKSKIQEPKSKIKPAATKTAGLSVPVYGLDGVKKGTVSLSKEVFGAKVNAPLMAQAVRVYLVNQRQGTQSTKTRGEVRGSTRKIYRQKGTGRARHGAITAPIFVGGGITFGPKPRNFELKLSKQMKRKALSCALSSKLAQDQIRVVDINGTTGKTKEISTLLQKLELVNKKGEGKVLFAVSSNNEKKGIKNLKSVELFPAKSINTYSVLNSKYLVFAKDAISELESLFSSKN